MFHCPPGIGGVHGIENTSDSPMSPSVRLSHTGAGEYTIPEQVREDVRDRETVVDRSLRRELTDPERRWSLAGEGAKPGPRKEVGKVVFWVGMHDKESRCNGFFTEMRLA